MLDIENGKVELIIIVTQQTKTKQPVVNPCKHLTNLLSLFRASRQVKHRKN